MRLVVEALANTYRDRRGHAVVALEDLDLSVEPEEFVAILGPSGCGKSTLLGIIAGLLPSSGRSAAGASRRVLRGAARERDPQGHAPGVSRGEGAAPPGAVNQRTFDTGD